MFFKSIVTDLETICIQHTDVPKVSSVVKYVCSQIPFLLSRGRIKRVRCDFFELGYYICMTHSAHHAPSPPAGCSYLDLPKGGLAVPVLGSHERCNSCTMTFTALTLLLVESKATWRSNWGLLAGAEAPPRKGGRRTLSNERWTARCVFAKGPSPWREANKSLRPSVKKGSG